MRTIIRIMVVLGLAIVLITPAFTVTLQPGTYKMEWKIPDRSEADYPAGMDFSVMSLTEAEKYSGLSSTHCMISTNCLVAFKVILDESKGTGTGYDTAYVMPATSENSKINVKKLAKILLKNKHGQLVSNQSHYTMVDIKLGKKGSQITKKVAVDLIVDMHSSEDGSSSTPFGGLYIWGGWYGTVKTDTGDIPIHLVDFNADCIYGDIDKLGLCDVIYLLTKSGVCEDEQEYLSLKKTTLYNNKLYIIKTSAVGDTIEIKPFTGD